jgi:hypothetical protein
MFSALNKSSQEAKRLTPPTPAQRSPPPNVEEKNVTADNARNVDPLSFVHAAKALCACNSQDGEFQASFSFFLCALIVFSGEKHLFGFHPVNTRAANEYEERKRINLTEKPIAQALVLRKRT